jgi:hypothetical protein
MKRNGFRSLFAILEIGLAACTAGCGHVPGIPAVGQVAGLPVSGSVDSPVARDYIEGRQLPAQIEAVRNNLVAARQFPSRELLRDVAHDYSADVATLLFIEALNANPECHALRQAFETELQHVRTAGIEGSRPQVPGDLLVLFVPGWFYVKHGSTTGGDFRAERKLFDRLGVPNRLIAVDENGPVEENSVVVARAIREASKEHRVLLVSASKSGPEVAQALGRELSHAESAKVVGWVSIGGVLRGSPFADRMLRPAVCWAVQLKLALEGFDMEGAKSLSTARAGRAFDALSLPPHVRTVSFVPTPLSGHITDRADSSYKCMKQLGPNDGLVMLTDQLIPNGTPLVIPGVDHFLTHPERDLWTVALFRVLMDAMPRDRRENALTVNAGSFLR